MKKSRESQINMSVLYLMAKQKQTNRQSVDGKKSLSIEVNLKTKQNKIYQRNTFGFLTTQIDKP